MLKKIKIKIKGGKKKKKTGKQRINNIFFFIKRFRDSSVNSLMLEIRQYNHNPTNHPLYKPIKKIIHKIKKKNTIKKKSITQKVQLS